MVDVISFDLFLIYYLERVSLVTVDFGEVEGEVLARLGNTKK